jgi:hypothetical protein
MGMPLQPMSTFRDRGLLWYINRVAFHPRGFALALDVDEQTGDIKGWTIMGSGSEAWYFQPHDDDECLKKIQALLAEATELNA